MIVLLVALAGGAGAATRFVLDGLVRARWQHRLPLATIAINVSGSLLIGLLTGGLLYQGLHPEVYVVLALGFCGGYTTFSTSMVETVRLVQSGEHAGAVTNVAVSLLASLAAAAVGVALMRALAGWS
ncbi:fluoride efflux transporter CrcB [Cellulomonas bogoriensis]|uniref:Fluoride-specific ion channel FluC n=1 Tax=Cellulomonas bogoriensis 69B4 = DSM 16987 TaxID=1386082 RepID=A0A0A0BYM1_9CELL|nr:fluoride efflux transporter CrcB [Cellulomonas bogoriensis]KGM13070.1 chromosome condensation protein CrcB [Cellulomonas bogoriensis 69B4 = DSM 16987]